MYPRQHRTIALQWGDNPTTDYYLRSRSDALETFDIRIPPPLQEFDLKGAVVIVVRYLTAEWLTWLEQQRKQLRRLIYLVDDDAASLVRVRGIPASYRRKLQSNALRPQERLLAMTDEVWVSTPLLAQRLKHRKDTKILPPLPLAVPTAPTPPPLPIRLFYHGTAVHHRELRWLRTVVKAVLQACPEATFELFGGSIASQLFAEMPRCTVRRPLPWPDYLVFSQQEGRHIGLVPLLPGRHNEARAATKLFDVTRMGAVGIYADALAYQPFVRHGENGLLLEMRRNTWIDELIGLIRDPARREAMASAAAQGLAALRDTPAPLPLHFSEVEVVQPEVSGIPAQTRRGGFLGAGLLAAPWRWRRVG